MRLRARVSRSKKTSCRQELRVYAVSVRVFASGALVRLRGAPSSGREGLPVTIERTLLLSGRRGGYNGVSATVRSALVESATACIVPSGPELLVKMGSTGRMRQHLGQQ